jgi:endonuclease YncB( thermonuclease family)
MSLGFYRVIKGRLVVRENQSPDGDSMRFIADDMSLFSKLPHYVPPSTSHGEASYQLRFQAIDTPELHYGGAAQPQGLESRNGLLGWLGVDSVAWDWVVAPKGFAWEQPAVILCDGFESHGRPIAFILKSINAKDGADVKLTKTLLPQTYNYFAAKTGLAYLGMYSGGLSADIKSALIKAYKDAKTANRGIWKLDRTSLFTVNTLEDISPQDGALIYPKIFRRCVDALRWAGDEFQPGNDLDDFLFAKPSENDHLVIRAAHGGQVKSQLSNVIEQINNQIRIQVDLNTVDFISK